jgi:hypothetical protein
MRGERKIMKTIKKRWARCVLPVGFAKRWYPKVSNCHMIKKSMTGRMTLFYGCQITCKKYRYSEKQEQQLCKVYSYTSPAQHGLPNDSIGSWGELESQFVRNFCSTYKRPTSLEEVKSCIQRRDETLRSYIQC